MSPETEGGTEMMTSTMVTREVARTVDQDRIRRAEAFRAGRRPRTVTEEAGAGIRTTLSSAFRQRAARAFTPRSWTRRRTTATTG
jgi:hypothetical protein